MIEIFLSIFLVGYVNINIPDWDVLLAGLERNERRLLDANKFEIQISRYSEITIRNSQYTSGYTKVRDRFGRSGATWFHRTRSISDLDSTVVSRGEISDPKVDRNFVYSPDDELSWSSAATVSRISKNQAIDLLVGLPTDFLGFDFRSLICRDLEVEDLSPDDMLMYAPQIERASLLKTANSIRNEHPESLVIKMQDGRTCWQFGVGFDVLTVCPELNFALVQRVAPYPGNNRLRLFELTNQNFYEAEREFWVPEQVSVKLFGTPHETPDLQNKHVTTLNYKVERVKIGNVSEGMVDPKFPKGFVVTDAKGGIVYRFSEDEISLRDGLEYGRQVVERRSDFGIPNPRLWSILVFVTFALAAILFGRRFVK